MRQITKNQVPLALPSAPNGIYEDPLLLNENDHSDLASILISLIRPLLP